MYCSAYAESRRAQKVARMGDTIYRFLRGQHVLNYRSSTYYVEAALPSLHGSRSFPTLSLSAFKKALTASSSRCRGERNKPEGGKKDNGRGAQDAKSKSPFFRGNAHPSAFYRKTRGPQRPHSPYYCQFDTSSTKDYLMFILIFNTTPE